MSSLLKYRALESGGSMAVEPKESLELEQSQIPVVHGSVDSNRPGASALGFQQVKDWCLTLSKIAHVVNQMLDIPSNLLLVRDDDTEDDNYDHDEGMSNDTTKDKSPQDRLDLLRVFYYHQVPKHPTGDDENSSTFGSSPHTDWGSWTVVWQDTVGGLETYCRRCQKWIAVPPNRSACKTGTTSTSASPESAATTNTNTAAAASNHHHQHQDYIWNCIVHVGDLASLALGKEPPPLDNHDDVDEDGNKKNNEGCIQWPSPRHRVVSPTQSTRTSLVYFAYPPPSLSLTQLQEALQVVHWNRNSRGVRLPLSEYYLLQDQSLSTSVSTTTCTATNSKNDKHDLFLLKEQQATASYQQLRNLSIRDIVQTKWAQVQRDSTGNSSGS